MQLSPLIGQVATACPRRSRTSSETGFDLHQRRQRTESLDRCENTFLVDNGRYPNATNIPQTCPACTKALWHLVQTQEDPVMSPDEVHDLRGSESSRSRATASRRARGARGSLTSRNSSMPQSIVTSSRTKRISPYDKDFRARALDPCGITIEQSPSVKAYVHFGVKEPACGRAEYYTQSRGARSSQVWLEENIVDDVQREYDCMQRSHLCEAEFASYAKETIFKRDPRVADLSTGARCWKTERTIELVAQVDKFWDAPPTLNQTETDQAYAFDLRPDCAYWLSLQAFSLEYQTQVKEWAFVVNRRITCPYLTIEFKKDNSNSLTAENQVASAGALALYNRFCLRRKRFRISQKAWGKQHAQILRHYGVTFMGCTFSIWCIEPKLTESSEWKGCCMTQIYFGDCMMRPNVLNLIDWINEIHCWGLTVHGPSCERDIKLCMGDQSTGFRISNIGPPSEDEPDEAIAVHSMK